MLFRPIKGLREFGEPAVRGENDESLRAYASQILEPGAAAGTPGINEKNIQAPTRYAEWAADAPKGVSPETTARYPSGLTPIGEICRRGFPGLLYFFNVLQGLRSPLARLTPAYIISPLTGLKILFTMRANASGILEPVGRQPVARGKASQRRAAPRE